MDEALVPAGDHHAGLARHPGMDGVATQIQAENPVLGRGRHTADDMLGSMYLRLSSMFFSLK